MSKSSVMGYLPNDQPPPVQMALLGFQHVLTMFPATVLVAALCGCPAADHPRTAVTRRAPHCRGSAFWHGA